MEKFNQISENKVILKYYPTITGQRRPLYRRQDVNVKEENNRRKKCFLDMQVSSQLFYLLW